MFAEAIDHILALWAGTAPIDRKGKYWTISTVRTLWPEVGIGDIVKPYQKPHPPIAGTATDPDSKGLIALGRRGWWPISSHFLHPNCLKSQWANYAKGCAEGGHKAERANWRVARSIFVAEDDKVAHYEESKARARTLSDGGMHAKVKKWIDYMVSDLALTSVGVLGFCLGGRYVLMAAAQDKRVKACAAAYPSIEN